MQIFISFRYDKKQILNRMKNKKSIFIYLKRDNNLKYKFALDKVV